jgi:hypothetical protein
MTEETMSANDETSRYSMTVRNRPGELLKLTKTLTDAGVNLSGLRVANLGDRASIQFSTARECVLPSSLRKARLD